MAGGATYRFVLVKAIFIFEVTNNVSSLLLANNLIKLITYSVFFMLTTKAKCLMGTFVRNLQKTEIWSIKCKALNKNGNVQ